MNKKEKQQLESAEHTRDLAFALRWSRATPLEHDIAVPTAADARVDGFTFNTYTRSTISAWSEHHRHGAVGSAAAQQNGIALYSTRKLALMALRHALELEFAATLLRIDAKIDEALA